MTKVSQNIDDPKGLIREAYRIEGITLGECRSIFLDWALSLPDGVAPQARIKALLEQYAPLFTGYGYGYASRIPVAYLFKLLWLTVPPVLKMG